MFLPPVRAATTGDITLNGEQSIDGVSVVVADRVLVKDQADPSENGVYDASSGAWTRSIDFDQTSEVVYGSYVLVLDGATQAESIWLLTTPDPIAVGTDPLDWQVVRDLSAFVTKTGTETLSGKTFSGTVDFVTDGGRIGITSGDEPIGFVEGTLHILNMGDAGVTALLEARWEGSAADPFTNNDNGLCVTKTRVADNSFNKCWGFSINNAYHNIPAGVTDSGERIGVIGWATSVPLAATADEPAYTHEGTLASQYGVQGAVGFQGPGSGLSAVIQGACAVRGLVYADSAGATIEIAQAGLFVSDGGDGVVEKNYAVYARAQNGTENNYSFYGELGKFFNADQIAAGSEVTQSSSSIAARASGNTFEFGHPDPLGYGSNLGATYAHGYPFLSFCAEVDTSGDTFRTRGKKGAVIWCDLAGALIFSRLTDASGTGLDPTESARFDADGHLVLVEKAIALDGLEVTGGIEIGDASDTTLARSSAGNLTIEGNLIYRAGGTAVPVADGGTGASDASGARANLGLVIGTDVAALASPAFTGSPTAPTAAGGTDTTQLATTAFVNSAISTASGSYQPLDDDLTALAGLTSAADSLPYFTGPGTAALTTFTGAGRALLDDADASAQRGTLGLGTASVLDAGSASGVATLDGSGKIPTNQLPGLALTDVYTVASEAAQLALTAEEGDIAIRTDLSRSYANNGGTAGTMADWSELLTPTDNVLSVNGETGAVTLSASDIGSTASGDVVATNVQGAIDELASEKLAVSAYTPADILAKLLTVDGSGSGLDADLLDGQSGAHYLDRANHTGTQTASTVSDFSAAADARIAAAVGISVQAYDSDLTTLGAGGTGARNFLGLGTGDSPEFSKVAVGSASSQSPSSVSARKAGNSFEFGHVDSSGYGSNIGATYAQGYPFVAFCAESDPTGNTFRTRGKKGAVISSNVAGALIFSRLTNASASGQSLTESGRFDADGHLLLWETPLLPSKTPASASATGIAGEVGWDSGYIYVCVAANTWKRVALASW